jgi:nitrite reductase (NO-forming)
MAMAGALAVLGGGPVAAEPAQLTFAPEVPPPITRRTPAVVTVHLTTDEVVGELAEGLGEPTRYLFWTFNGRVPGPFIRTRVGDTLELTITNPKTSGMDHNIDLHAVTGPGGGAKVTLVKPGETKTVRLKLLNPGLYIYHCAAPPVTDHIANGMYGLILVEPEGGLPKVDREFYVLQSEFYIKEDRETEGLVHYDREKALAEHPTFVVFNGRVGSLTGPRALKAKVGETIRIYFGNAGPNLISSWHVIGEIFDRLWVQGGIGAEPIRNIQTTLVPAGGSVIAEFKVEVPGDYTLVDHSIFRLEKGAVGVLTVEGPANPEIFPRVEAAK